MRYLLYDKDQIEKLMVYCDKNGEETVEDIVKTSSFAYFAGKFISKEHEPIKSPIKNDENMFILIDINTCIYIYQVCGMLIDCRGTIIPHLYSVKVIGRMFN